MSWFLFIQMFQIWGNYLQILPFLNNLLNNAISKTSNDDKNSCQSSFYGREHLGKNHSTMNCTRKETQHTNENCHNNYIKRKAQLNIRMLLRLLGSLKSFLLQSHHFTIKCICTMANIKDLCLRKAFLLYASHVSI